MTENNNNLPKNSEKSLKFSANDLITGILGDINESQIHLSKVVQGLAEEIAKLHKKVNLLNYKFESYKNGVECDGN